MYNPTTNQLMDLGEAVLYEAMAIFDHCQAPDDFGIQHIHSEGAIFGGTNRLIWRPAQGFWPDPSYCTKRFLEKFKTYNP